MKTATKKKPSSSDAELARLQGQVHALRRQLQHAQRLATMGTMTAMVAHEFNNILTPIVNYAQLARTNPALAEKAIARAADGGHRATAICQAILGLARDSAPQEATITAAALIEQSLAVIAREPSKDGIELVIDAPAHLSITTRPIELEQVLLNLIINARSAVLAQPGLRRIAISVASVDDKIVFCISDNGGGIPRKNLQKIFEPYFTTRKSGESQDGGSGLGLAICRQLVEGLGGQIAAESEPGQGAKFIVTLPVKLA